MADSVTEAHCIEVGIIAIRVRRDNAAREEEALQKKLRSVVAECSELIAMRKEVLNARQSRTKRAEAEILRREGMRQESRLFGEQHSGCCVLL